ncbi:MAG: tRNA pseudouridine(55) synthase TruB [Clostridia bacterium]|nr:tRNA pseudouridine(55) synthase TruB [Clostridia bacterium]
MTGFICLDKPIDITSFSAVGIVKRAVGEKKAGHTGTLDPLATGVLPIALGGATRFIELFNTHDKAYEAIIQLGMTTDTLDITGNVITQTESHIKKEEVLKVLENFRGNIRQIPPMYSALKKDGVRLYELARRGEEIEREEREITIYSLTLDDFNEEKQTFSISVECSAGTYIRSLSDDIGRLLGCGATLTALRRTKALGFTVDDCVTEDELKQLADEGRVEEVLVSVERAMKYDTVTVTDNQAKRFRNGGYLECVRIKTKLKPESYYKVCSHSGEFAGIGEVSPDGDRLNVKRVYMGDLNNG